MNLRDIQTDTPYKFKSNKLRDGRMSYFVLTEDGTVFGAIVRTGTSRGPTAEFFIFPIKNDGKGFYRNSISTLHGRDTCAITLRKWWAEKNGHTTKPVRTRTTVAA